MYVYIYSWNWGAALIPTNIAPGMLQLKSRAEDKGMLAEIELLKEVMENYC